MENSIIRQKVPENLKRRLVACVRKALHDDLPRYLMEFNPDTKNAVPRFIIDQINTNIRNDLACENVIIHEFKRPYGWTGKIIIDKQNCMTYNISREKRISQIRKEKRSQPNYLQTLVSVLNKEYEAPVKQMTLFNEGTFSFDIEILENDYDSIFCGCLASNAGFIHCTIVYDTIQGDLSDIKILFLD